MTISSIIGADETLIEIERILHKEKSCTIHFTGSSGSGKSWIVTQLVEKLTESDYCCINLYGDHSRKSEPYYPLKQFIERKDRVRTRSVSVLKESIGELPYVGKGIQALIKDYDFKKHKKTIQEIVPFRNHVDFSLHLLGLHRKYKKILISCDDVEEFDSNTLNYLSGLEEGFNQLNESFNISFLLISEYEANIQQFIGLGNTFNISIPALSQVQIKQLLFFWSGKEIPDEQLAIINSCSGEHLSLLKLIAEHLKEANELKATQNVGAFFKGLIDSRLKKLKDSYDLLKSLLQAIAKSGKPSTTYEMLCLLGEENDIRELIQQAIQMDLLIIKDNYIHFTHPIIEDYITSFQNKPKASFYDKLSLCTKKLTPANYSRRAHVERLAHNLDQADIYWGLAAIKKMREGAFPEVIYIKNEITTSDFGHEIEMALKQFEVCHELSFKGEIDETLLEIEQIPNSLPKELLAEKNFLKCENLAKKIANSPKEEALNIISNWEDIKEEEPEIWYRFMQLRIITAAELGFIDLAKKTETDIVKYFSSRLAYDIHARPILEKLNLFSEVIYSPEIAHKKMLQAEKWLEKEVVNEQFHKVIDLFIARTNLSSNSILVDDMQKSINYANGAIALTRDFQEVRFPGIEAPLSNYYLAMMWADNKNLPLILEGYRELYDSSYIEENKILIDINYAGLLLLNNRTKEAFEVLKKGAYIPDKIEDDSYYCYYYWCNYSIAAFLLGHVDEAQKHFAELEPVVQKVSVFLKKYYVKHYQMMNEVLNNPQIKSYEGLRNYFEERAPIFSSKLWDRFKTGYLLTDIQIWTSS